MWRHTRRAMLPGRSARGFRSRAACRAGVDGALDNPRAGAGRSTTEDERREFRTAVTRFSTGHQRAAVDRERGGGSRDPYHALEVLDVALHLS